MKGVPRVFKSETPCLRSVWLCTVIVFLGLSIYQSSQLIGEYLEFNTVTQTTEVIMHPSRKNFLEMLPTISICNLNPLSSNRSRYAGLPTLSNYYDLVRNVTACNDCNATTRRWSESVRSELLRPWGYYQYIGMENASRVGHQVDDMFVACHFYVIDLDGSRRRKLDCGNTLRSRVIHVTDPNFFNCFLTNIQISDDSWFSGLSLTVYLDNFHDDDDDFHLFNEFGQSTGVLFEVQNRHELPIPSILGREIPPGVASSIRILPEKRRRLPAPHSRCRRLTKESRIYAPHLNLKPTPEICVSKCLENAIKEQCQCLDLYLLTSRLSELHKTVTPFCADIKEGATRLYSRMLCAQNIREVMISPCVASCSRLCHEVRYIVSTANAKWPDNSKLRSFYKNILRNKPYRERFNIFEDIPPDGNGSLRDSPQFRRASDLVRDNFLQLFISLEDFKYVDMHATPKLSLTALISQLGGTLNLWSGISAIFFVEVGELIFRILVKRDVATTPENQQ